MNRILKIGMDVHSTNYTLCVVEPKLEGDPDLLYEVQVEPDCWNILQIIEKLKQKYKEDQLFITCGYEAGCLGYTLYHELEDHGIKCVILAPSTIEMPGGKRIKTESCEASHFRNLDVPTARNRSTSSKAKRLSSLITSRSTRVHGPNPITGPWLHEPAPIASNIIHSEPASPQSGRNR